MKFLIASIIFSVGLVSIVYAAQPAASTPATIAPIESVAHKNEMKSEAFLATNKKKPDVKTLPSGLQYKVITEGAGPKPTANDVVTVDYAGRLIDGTEFDSSYKRGQPATFEVGGVIPGWTEALQIMNKGSTYELYIPAKLAYGDQGVPPVIGPNQALIFTVKLIDVKKE